MFIFHFLFAFLFLNILFHPFLFCFIYITCVAHFPSLILHAFPFLPQSVLYSRSLRFGGESIKNKRAKRRRSAKRKGKLMRFMRASMYTILYLSILFFSFSLPFLPDFVSNIMRSGVVVLPSSSLPTLIFNLLAEHAHL